MSSEIASQLERRSEERRSARRPRRVLAVEAIGPITVVGGIVWATVQPYRIAFFAPAGKGLYDFLVQPPLLVVLVGLAYGLLVAPGLVSDLEQHDERASP